MFVLTEMSDLIRTPPRKFNVRLKDAIEEELNKKLANKVVLNVGLCISLYDITNMEESYIFPGDGACHTKVKFRYVVFRPFMDEVLTGKIRSCSPEGVHVTIGFFDDILIPPTALQYPSEFDKTEQVWVWKYKSSEEDDEHDLYMDADEEIRFRVTAENFVETCPTGPETAEVPKFQSGETVKPEPKIPYSLTAGINEPGLGLIKWWNQK